MKPEVYAKGLKQKHGMENALRIAEGTLKTTKIVNGYPLETPPQFDEVEITTDDKGKDRITVDQPMKLKRLKKSEAFWKNVVIHLKKLEAATSKKQKA